MWSIPRGRSTSKKHSAVFPEQLVEKILENFTEEDYLLLIGDPVSIGIATHYAAKKTDVVKFLKWDNREYTYFPVEVKFR